MNNVARFSLFVITAAAMGLVACSDKDTDGDGDNGAAEHTDSGAAADASADATPDAGDPRCLPDGGFVDPPGNPCDLCENAHCCATRFGCYDNTSCDGANMAFDACLAAAQADGGAADAGAAIAKCWADLSASGAVAKARVDCQRASCKTECSVP